MKIKAKHLRHPLRSISTARNRFATQRNTRKFARLADSKYTLDPRYNPQHVTDGYASRLNDNTDDTALLHRICRAYNKAVVQQALAPEIYQPTAWWNSVRRDNLGPVTSALLHYDTVTLQTIYRNFFRDPCSAGLSPRPLDIAKSHNRRFTLGDALYRLDYWNQQLASTFDIKTLSGPNIGNPFGIVLNDTFIPIGSEYQHFCAEKIRTLLTSQTSTVAEIGGGLGGMAYYLLRDPGSITYIDFDVPESIALTAYFLIKAFPHQPFHLYGEDEPTTTTHKLLPLFALPNIPPQTIDLTFSSHAMSDLSAPATLEYLNQVSRSTRDYFWTIGNYAAGHTLNNIIRKRFPTLVLEQTQPSEWNKHRISNARELELLYRIQAAKSRPISFPNSVTSSR